MIIFNESSLSGLNTVESPIGLNTIYYNPPQSYRKLLFSAASNVSSVTLSEDSRNFKYLSINGDCNALIAPYNAGMSTAQFCRYNTYSRWTTQMYYWWRGIQWKNASSFTVQRTQLLEFRCNSSNIAYWGNTASTAGYRNCVNCVYGYYRVSGGE
jgi:hypothetical protein